MQAPQEAMLLRIYTEEGKRDGDGPLYEHIVMKAREAKLAGATVLRGPMGYGQTAVLHTAKIEIVDAEDKIRAFLAELDDLPDLGLVTLEKVEVVHYGGKAGR
jgi:PII-like signaling protein